MNCDRDRLLSESSLPLTINVDAESATSDLPSSISSSVNSFVYQPTNTRLTQEAIQKQMEELTVRCPPPPPSLFFSILFFL